MSKNKIFPKKLGKNAIAIFYKLLNDSLFVAIIFFTLTLIAEAILPGIIISHIGFSKMVITILLNIFLLKVVAKKIAPDQIDEKNCTDKENIRKIILLFLVLGILLFLSNQLGMNVFLSFFIILLCIAIGYLSYHILFHEE
jgi:hypothetical protein